MEDYDGREQDEQLQAMYELALVQRIARGISTVEDARYVATAFGLTTERKDYGQE